MNLIRLEPANLPAINTSLPSLEKNDVHLWILRGEVLQYFSEKRAALRHVLSLYTGAPASQIEFKTEGEGKPLLKPDQNRHGLHFNLSHSGDTQIIAVTRIGPVGVDIEKMRPFKRLDAFVERFFFPSERKRIETAPPTKTLRVFFTIWTAKEAWAKARGKSVFKALTHFEYQADDPSLSPIDLGTEYVGHVVVLS